MDKKLLIVVVVILVIVVGAIGYLMITGSNTTPAPTAAPAPKTTPSSTASTTSTNKPTTTTSSSTPATAMTNNTASTNQTSTLPQTISTAATPSNTSTNTTSSGNTNTTNTGTTEQVLMVNPNILDNKPLIHTIPREPIILKVPEPVLIDAKEYPPVGNINWMNDPTDSIVGLRGIKYDKKKYTVANNSYGNGEYVTWGNTMADNNQYAVQGLFDKNIKWVYSSNAGWHTGWGDLYSNTVDSATPAEVYIKLPRPITLTAYEIYPRGDGGALAQTQGAIKWILQGSNDNVNYTTINSQDNITGWTNLQSKMFPVSTTTKYSYYKWVFYRAGSNNATIVLNEIKLYGYE